MYWRDLRHGAQVDGEAEMENGTIKPGRRTKIRTKTEKPRLYKVILLNDDYTPREFVIGVLKKVFGM
jgi:ATP-dependent Clp protease adaptor protein ClpS